MANHARRRGRRLLVVLVGLLAATVLAGTSALPAGAAGAAPVIGNDYIAGRIDRTLTVPAPGLLANDTDAEGDPLTARLGSSTTSYGTLDLRADGSFTYTPGGFNPGYDWFFYEVSDGTSWSAQGQVILSLYGDPVGETDRYALLGEPFLLVPAATGVLLNDIGQPALSSWLAARPRSGWLLLVPDGSFLYVPRPGFVGTDTFTYRLRDASGVVTPPVTVRIDVAPSNQAPVAVGDHYQLDEDGYLDVGAPGLLANDTDADGQQLRAELVGVSGHGSVDVLEDGSFAFQPDMDRDDDVSFTYRVTDGFAWSPPATVTIDIIAINDPPIAEGDTYAIERDGVLSIPSPGVLANDYDPVEFDGPLVHGLVAGPQHGTLDLRADGSFVYTPDAGFVGWDFFVYQVGDVGGAGGSASVEIEVYDLSEGYVRTSVPPIPEATTNPLAVLARRS
jgi:hypothetical protein